MSGFDGVAFVEDGNAKTVAGRVMTLGRADLAEALEAERARPDGERVTVTKACRRRLKELVSESDDAGDDGRSGQQEALDEIRESAPVVDDEPAASEDEPSEAGEAMSDLEVIAIWLRAEDPGRLGRTAAQVARGTGLHEAEALRLMTVDSRQDPKRRRLVSLRPGTFCLEA